MGSKVVIRDFLAACSTVGAIFAWWAVVFLLAGCAALGPAAQIAAYVVNGIVGVKTVTELVRVDPPPPPIPRNEERPDATP